MVKERESERDSWGRGCSVMGERKGRKSKGWKGGGVISGGEGGEGERFLGKRLFCDGREKGEKGRKGELGGGGDKWW